MTGVDILSAEEVVTSTAFNFKLAFLIGGITLICIILLARFIQGDWDDIIITIVCGLMLSGIFGVFAGEMVRIPVEYTTEYKVTISNEVSMKEFLEHYEIVDSEGKIFTIREINN